MNERSETVDEKRRVEAMVTAILTNDPLGQTSAADGLTASEERYVRAGASIVAGLFHALGPQMGVAPSRLWREHMKHTSESRSRHGRDEAGGSMSTSGESRSTTREGPK